MRENSNSPKIAEKSLTQHCERSELPLYFEWTKVHQNGQFDEFLKILQLAVKQCYQTQGHGQKLLENAKIEKIKCDILSNF